LASQGLEPDGRESELLRLAEGLQDRISQLERAIAAEGLTKVTKGGLVRMHPAVAEARQTRGVLARVLSHISMTDSVKNPAKQAAAQSRWREHNLAKKRVYGG
jgi:hypothetical protein